jgi:thiol:disulfide interchange protein
MGAPYLVLAAYPKLVESIPRTGPASELVKQVMGLLLLAAAAYFIGSGLIGLVAEQPWMARLLHWWAITIALILAGSWLTLRTFQITSNWGSRITWLVVSVILAFIPTWYSIRATEKARVTYEAFETARLENPGSYLTNVWNLYDPITFEAARSDGKIVVVDFTAEWCINCKALKAGVLDVEPVKSRLADSDQIVMFTADNTSRKAPGWELMSEIGQTGIPLLAIWSQSDSFDAPWQSNAYTSNQVIEALTAAESERGDS